MRGGGERLQAWGERREVPHRRTPEPRGQEAVASSAGRLLQPRPGAQGACGTGAG